MIPPHINIPVPNPWDAEDLPDGYCEVCENPPQFCDCVYPPGEDPYNPDEDIDLDE